MKQEKQNLYEGMYIISSKLSDDAKKKAMERIKSEITGRGGIVEREIDWGRRRLAYEIDGNRDGHYFVIYFTVRPSAISEMWKEYHLNEDLVRFFTTRTDKILEKIEFKSLAEIQ